MKIEIFWLRLCFFADKSRFAFICSAVLHSCHEYEIILNNDHEKLQLKPLRAI